MQLRYGERDGPWVQYGPKQFYIRMVSLNSLDGRRLSRELANLEKPIISQFNRYTRTGILDVRSLVDLVRFDPTTSSMPFKKYQSLADSLAQNKRLSEKGGWTPVDATGRSHRKRPEAYFHARGCHVVSVLLEPTTSDSSIRMMPSGAVTAFAASKRQLAFSQYCE